MTSDYGETPLGLASQILNLAALLTRRSVLRIPRYQRPYTWTQHEVRQLIQDLWRAHTRQATFYFIGQIVLVKNAHNELEVSDGQQRLATLTMIIAYARDRLPHRAAHYQGLIMQPEDMGGRPRLRLRVTDANFYRMHVQEPNSFHTLARLQQTGYDSRDMMCGAAATIEAELEKVVEPDQLDAFISFIVRCATFNVVEADERGAAAGIYNAMNNTGQDLSAADNIKCDLLEDSSLTDADADKAAKQWEDLENDLGREDFAALINMMPFLMTGAPLISPGDLGAFRAVVESSGGVADFLSRRLPRYGETLRDIFRADVKIGPASAEVNRRIALMLQLAETRWLPSALVLLAEHPNADPTHVAKFFQALERFTFGCELAVIDNTVREDRFSLALKQVADPIIYNGGNLDLSNAERHAFVERLNRSSKTDKMRKMLLIRIEAALPGGKVLSRRSDITVEHILPVGNAPWWAQQVPDPVLRADYANMLGNLLLVTRKQNQKADNRPFPEKHDIYFHTKGAPIHESTRTIEGVTNWTLDAIDKRHENLIGLLCADWDISGEILTLTAR